jgi:hypothetical protein
VALLRRILQHRKKLVATAIFAAWVFLFFGFENIFLCQKTDGKK